MGRGRPAKQKDEWADLDDDFKTAVLQSSVEQVNLRIAETAKSEEENKRLKKEDGHLLEMKAQYDEAGAQYKEATKANRLKIRYMVSVLKSRGGK
jgi:hypothetical protein